FYSTGRERETLMGQWSGWSFPHPLVIKGRCLSSGIELGRMPRTNTCGSFLGNYRVIHEIRSRLGCRVMASLKSHGHPVPKCPEVNNPGNRDYFSRSFATVSI